MILHLLSLLLGALYGLFIAFGGVWAPFIVTVPSFLFNCFLSLAVFMSGQLQIKCLGLLQWKQHLSSIWVSFTALANWTMNSSVTPLIPLGSSLSRILTIIGIFLFQLCTRCMVGFLGNGWLPFNFLKGKKLVVLGLDGLSVAWVLEALRTTQLNVPFQPPWWP